MQKSSALIIHGFPLVLRPRLYVTAPSISSKKAAPSISSKKGFYVGSWCLASTFGYLPFGAYERTADMDQGVVAARFGMVANRRSCGLALRFLYSFELGS